MEGAEMRLLATTAGADAAILVAARCVGLLGHWCIKVARAEGDLILLRVCGPDQELFAAVVDEVRELLVSGIVRGWRVDVQSDW
jgi:hypothetical protein